MFAKRVCFAVRHLVIVGSPAAGSRRAALRSARFAAENRFMFAKRVLLGLNFYDYINFCAFDRKE